NAAPSRAPEGSHLGLPGAAGGRQREDAVAQPGDGGRYARRRALPGHAGAGWRRQPLAEGAADAAGGAGANAGDTVALEITPVAVEPEPEVPPDLRKALAANPAAKATWDEITPLARRDWIQWMTSGKKAETRVKRIASGCDMLASGKRRACCFDRSGMYSRGNMGPPDAAD